MINILDYLRLSSTARTIKETYSSPKEFLDNYFTINSTESKCYFRHFLINNIPYAFRDYPILFEELIQYLADKLEINVTDIRLIGSAKTGFSISPPPYYGKEFGPHSDIDFSIIQEDLFYSLEADFQNWKEQFKTKQILPRNQNEEYYWPNNIDTGNNQLKNGIFDTILVPNYTDFPTVKMINNSLSLIKINLENIYDFKVKKVSARVYRNWTIFFKRINNNTSALLQKINTLG